MKKLLGGMILVSAVLTGCRPQQAKAPVAAKQHAKASAVVRDLTPGWTPGPQKIVYPDDAKAIFLPKSAADYDIRWLDGAAGKVRFLSDGLQVVKTNDKGAVSIVTKNPVSLAKARALRVSAEVEGRRVGPGSKSYLRIGPKPADGALIPWEQKTLGFVFAGRDKMETLYLTPRGRPQQKIAQVAVTAEDVFVEIRIVGAASESCWRNLRVDDVDEVIAADLAVRMQPRNYRADVTDEAAYFAKLASDREHTAKVVRADDYAQLRVDGEIVPPVLYLSYGSEDAAKIVHGGRRMQEIGMPLQVVNASFTSPRKGEKPIWTAEGFDARRAVAYVSRQMRTAPDALFLICIGCNLPEDIRLSHPEDYWLDAKGEPCLGDDGHLFGGEAVPLAKKVYPWLSYSSPAWRYETKRMIAALIAELKRTGLAKRIVGVHFGGGHDGQFCTAQPDFSKCAKAAFGKSGEKDYVRFLKRVPQEMMDDFARAARQAFGKEIVVFRWCQRMFDSRYCSSHDIDAFEDSKEVDAIVTQPNYFHRSAGLVSALGVPFSSFHSNGKLYIREHDLRTYGAWGCRGNHHNVVKDAGLSRSTDLSDWCAVNRKMAGQMLARRTGFWYYDMQSGWYDPPEIAAEIRDVLDIARRLYVRTPDPWRPTAALVIDEEDLRGLQSVDGPCGAAAYPLFTFFNNVASSGVPFDIWMKRDFTSARAARYRYVVTYDRATKGLSAEALNAAAAKAGAFVAAKGGDTLVEMSGDFLSLHALTRGVRKIRLPRPCAVLNLKTSETVPVSDGCIEADLDVGETRWYALGAFADEFKERK
ncbi:MAG: hypothetical protein PUJ80_03155 [Verrucomicrobiota bacterium]|nr:hypothetical protein [Verrucomicrobiota bacterium]